MRPGETWMKSCPSCPSSWPETPSRKTIFSSSVGVVWYQSTTWYECTPLPFYYFENQRYLLDSYCLFLYAGLCLPGFTFALTAISVLSMSSDSAVKRLSTTKSSISFSLSQACRKLLPPPTSSLQGPSTKQWCWTCTFLHRSWTCEQRWHKDLVFPVCGSQVRTFSSTYVVPFKLITCIPY